MSANSNDTATETKAAYQPPKLRVYGDVRDITQNVGKIGLGDGGNGNDKSIKA